MSSQVINKEDIAQSFGNAAHTYDSVAHFQRWVGDRLVAKHRHTAPKVIVDLGCGTGYFSDQLQLMYPDASYIGVDLSEQMLSYAKAHHAGDYWLAGDAESLPFSDGSIDLIFSSLAIQWCSDLPKLFKEIKRVLAPNGVFVFSTLLDGTLVELKDSWAEVDKIEQHVNEFPFLDDYRDAIEVEQLRAISLEQETKLLQYRQVKELTRELKLLGAHNIRNERPKHLTGKERIRAFIAAYEKYRMADGLLPASYQVLFGVVSPMPTGAD